LDEAILCPDLNISRSIAISTVSRNSQLKRSNYVQLKVGSRSNVELEGWNRHSIPIGGTIQCGKCVEFIVSKCNRLRVIGEERWAGKGGWCDPRKE
jgi:hypothetical protein